MSFFISQGLSRRGSHRGLSRRGLFHRGLLASAAVGCIGVGLGAVSMLTGCDETPQTVKTVVLACRPMIARIFGLPVSELPNGYRLCLRQPFDVGHGRMIDMCVYCNDEPGAPEYIRIGCTGMYRSVTFESNALQQSPLQDSQPQVRGVGCDERLDALAFASADSSETHLDTTIVLPNDRTLPDLGLYAELTVTANGMSVPPSGEYELARGTQLRIAGPFELAAHYATALGIESIDYKSDGARWHVAFNAECSVIGVLRNDQLYDVRFLTAPQP